MNSAPQASFSDKVNGTDFERWAVFLSGYAGLFLHSLSLKAQKTEWDRGRQEEHSKSWVWTRTRVY